jgi:probable rRNA maturation factor
LGLSFTNKLDGKRFDNEFQVRKLIFKLINNENKKLGEISVVLTDNRDILEINRSFLSHHYYTDVITFDTSKRNVISGDIFISIDQVKLNAIKYKTEYNKEIVRVIIHGVLHLVGYNDADESEKFKMRSLEDSYLCEL